MIFIIEFQFCSNVNSYGFVIIHLLFTAFFLFGVKLWWLKSEIIFISYYMKFITKWTAVWRKANIHLDSPQLPCLSQDKENFRRIFLLLISPHLSTIAWLTKCPYFHCCSSFPNVYPLRGLTNRDAMEWVTAVDIIRELEAEYLVPGHCSPMIGRDKISEACVVYRLV